MCRSEQKIYPNPVAMEINCWFLKFAGQRSESHDIIFRQAIIHPSKKRTCFFHTQAKKQYKISSHICESDMHDFPYIQFPLWISSIRAYASSWYKSKLCRKHLTGHRVPPQSVLPIPLRMLLGSSNFARVQEITLKGTVNESPHGHVCQQHFFFL